MKVSTLVLLLTLTCVNIHCSTSRKEVSAISSSALAANTTQTIETARQRLAHRYADEHRTTRIVAFGSSNTERCLDMGYAMNWVDWVDILTRKAYGRVHTTINVGRAGETASQGVARFDHDVAFYQPNIVIITFGGNDSNPALSRTPQQFHDDMTEIISRCRKIPHCMPILQTYYSFDGPTAASDPFAVHHKQFLAYMQIVRDVAKETNTPLIDHLARWERLRKADPILYHSLMLDRLHMNDLGNAVFALDVCRFLHVGITNRAWLATTASSRRIQSYMDALETNPNVKLADIPMPSTRPADYR